MAEISCHPINQALIERYLLPPVQEGKNQLFYSYFLEESSPRSPLDRVAHLTTALLLFIPLVNQVVYQILLQNQQTLSHSLAYAIFTRKNSPSHADPDAVSNESPRKEGIRFPKGKFLTA